MDKGAIEISETTKDAIRYIILADATILQKKNKLNLNYLTLLLKSLKIISLCGKIILSDKKRNFYNE